MTSKGLAILLFLTGPAQFAVAQCPAITVNSVSVTNVACRGGSTGAVSPAFTGGTSPYTFFWSPTGHTSRVISGIPAGTYSITATDANGCSGTFTFTVTEALSAGPVASDVSVCKDDEVTLTTSGAVTENSYKWYTSATATTAIPGETASTYSPPGKIKATTTWYVSKVSELGCESAPTPVTARMINPLYPLVDLDSSMVMHYKFDNNLADSTGRNGDAAAFRRTNFVADRNAIAASALRLQVVDDMMDDYGYVDFPASNDLQTLTDKLTISFWMTRNTALGVIAPLLNKWQGGTGFLIGTRTTNPATFERKIYWQVGATTMTSDLAIPPLDNIWHHVVCIYTGSELQVYQNGVFAGSVPHTGNIPVTTVNMRAGRLADNSTTSRFTGRIDELRIYNRVLTANEIETLYNNESVAFENTPVCEGSAINLTTLAIPGAGFQWTGPASFSSSAQNPVIAAAASSNAGSYSLTVSKGGCTSVNISPAVVVNPLPSADITTGTPSTVCEGTSVTLTATAGASYLWSTGATSQDITVSSGDTYTVQVTGANGCARDSDPFTLTVTPVNDAPTFTKGADIEVDEDAAAQTVNGWATAISAGPSEGSQTLTFHVSNDNPDLFSVQPVLAASGNLSYTLAPDAFGTAQMTVSLSDDGGTACDGEDRSADQFFSITVNPINDAPSFTKGGDVIVNEDAGPQTISGWATDISAGTDESSQTVTFDVSNDDNGLFSVQPFISAAGVLSFTPSPDQSGVATVTVSLRDDGGAANGGIDQSTAQTFTISVNPINDAPAMISGGDVIVLEDAGPQTINGWATAISAGVNESGQTVDIDISNDNTALFSAPPVMNTAGTLTFTPASDAFGTAMVSVVLRDDGGTDDGGMDESLVYTFSITVDPVNDVPFFTRGIDIVVNEDDPAQLFNAWASGLSPGVNESGQMLTFHVSNDNNTLFSVQPAVNAAGGLSVTPAPDAFGTATVTLFLMDDGGTANGGIDQSAVQTFTITVNEVNDAPTMIPGDDVTVPEDAGPQTISGWATGISAGMNEPGQSVVIDISNDNTTLFSTQPAVSAAGMLTFTPTPDAFGTANVSVVLRDDGGTAHGGVNERSVYSFIITVDPLNDVPSFNKGNDIVVNEDVPAQLFNAWASGISPGVNESGQAVTFYVSNDNNALFSVQPAVNAAGALSFTPAPDAFGEAVVTLFLKDDAGTASGGVDQSVTQTFTIIVNPVNDAPRVDPVDDLTITVNSEPFAVNLTGIHPGAGEEHQALSFAVSSGDQSVLPDELLTITSHQGEASITLTPLAGVTGVVTVTVTIQDNGGTASGGVDVTTLSFQVNIEEEIQGVFLPNLFTPDHNGVNDVFRVRGAGIEQIDLRIYNVDGQELFATTDIHEATETGWDGKHKGKEQPAGTYIWTLKGRYTDGRPLSAGKDYGQVVLVR